MENILTRMRVENLKCQYLEKSANDNEIFKQEFKNITDVSDSICLEPDEYQKEENQSKNRYDFIHGYDHSKVTLSRKSGGNYINASYIDEANWPSKFIATQGPLQSTIGDFWQMVWEQNARIIVMLANVIEKGHVKCDLYWPTYEKLILEDLTVEPTGEKAFGEFIRRSFRIVKKEKKANLVARNVVQLHYTSWPDRGVPVTTSGLIRLHEEMTREWEIILARKSNSESTKPGPIITHCSAGVGRTGTFICYDILCEKIKNEVSIDVPDIVIGMRKRRTLMLQTLVQYVYVHKLILEKISLPKTDYPTKKWLEIVQGKNWSCREEFVKLREITNVEVRSKNFQDISTEEAENKRNNDDGMILGQIEIYQPCDKVFITQYPYGDNKEQFWRIVGKNKVPVVVNLSYGKDIEQTDSYWPKYGASKEWNGMTVSNTMETELEAYIKSHINITTREKEDVAVTHLQYKYWGRDSLPTNKMQFLNFTQQCVISDSSLIVHCSSGLKNPAIFCSILAILKRRMHESRIDVFRSVKDVKDYLPNSLETLDQYKFVYEVVKTCAQSFQEHGPV